MMSYKTIMIGLIVGVVFTQTSNTLAAQEAFKGHVVYGPIEQSEMWADKVYLIGDVTVPEGLVLTVLPGTEIHFSDYDLLESGDDKTKPEIIIEGTFDVQSTEANPVTLHQLNKSQYEIGYQSGIKTQVITFDPYHVDTKPIHQEFRRFKTQYLILWSLVYLLAYTQLTY